MLSQADRNSSTRSQRSHGNICDRGNMAARLIRLGCDHHSLISSDLAANVKDDLFAWGVNAHFKDRRRGKGSKGLTLRILKLHAAPIAKVS